MAVWDVFDAVVFSGTWVALAACALVAAVARALDVDVGPAALVLAFAGTFAVYGVDRLRDVRRDAATSPVRTAFVRRHGRMLEVASIVAVVVAAGAAVALGPRGVAVSVFAGGLGAVHRIFKRVPFFKTVYVSAAWLAVVVGLPATAGAPGPAPAMVAWACVIVAPALLANAAAFSARDMEAVAARLGPRAAVRSGVGCSALGVVASIVAPAHVRMLGAVPLATAFALAGFRGDERYVSGMVDGALVVGGLVVMLR